MEFTKQQTVQLKAAQSEQAYKKRGEYDRSADKKIYFFYPCEGYVIRVYGNRTHGWTGILTLMNDRGNAIVVRIADTRHQAVSRVIAAMLH